MFRRIGMRGTREHLPNASRRARRQWRALGERGAVTFTVTLSAVAVGVGVVSLFAVTSSPSHDTGARAPHTADGNRVGMQVVADELQRDVGATGRVVVNDRDGCGRNGGTRAVMSFESSHGKVVEQASWFVEDGVGEHALVRRQCVGGHVTETRTLASISGTPLVACLPDCTQAQRVRFSFVGAQGLASVVAYRKATS